MSTTALSYELSPNVINLLSSTAHQCHCCYRTVSGNCAHQINQTPPHPKILWGDVTIHNRKLSESRQFSFAEKCLISITTRLLISVLYEGINDT